MNKVKLLQRFNAHKQENERKTSGCASQTLAYAQGFYKIQYDARQTKTELHWTNEKCHTSWDLVLPNNPFIPFPPWHGSDNAWPKAIGRWRQPLSGDPSRRD